MAYTLPVPSRESGHSEYQDEPVEESIDSGTHMGEEGRHELSRQSQATLAEHLTKNETEAVRCLRLVVLLVLLLTATLVSVGAYLYMKNDEQDTFQEQYFDLAYRLVDGFHANAKLRVQVLDMFSTMLTSSAQATDQVWPFVTTKDFDAQATAALSILGAHYLGVYPFVVKELRRPWEEYTQSVNNLQWINESLAFQEFFMETHNRSSDVTRQSRALLTEINIDFDSEELNITVKDVGNNSTFDGTYGTNPQLFRARDPDNPDETGRWINEDPNAEGPFFPMWQMAPAIERIVLPAINNNVFDLLAPSSFINAIGVVQETGTAVFGGVWNVDEDGYIDENDDFDDRNVPAASLIYPVFDKIVPDEKGGQRSVAAVIDLDYEFGPFFSSVLPPNADPVIAVVSNCDQIFTYEVTGATAMYLGAEDLHDPNYDDFVVSTLMTNFGDANGGTVYNGAPINKDYCPWELHVYATQQMEDKFVTTAPLYYMLALLGISLFTCAVFILYDRLVELRQKKVMKTAVKSDHIVSSLFPTMFRDALYHREGSYVTVNADESKGNDPFPVMGIGSKNAQAYFVSNLSSQDLLTGLRSEPLAKLYPKCTVFFGDITGFTAWSSARSPWQVFTLLETLFAEFDILADKHHIFKVETIGDCYVCVTGLPEPQPTHALRMVRFARDCLGKMSALTMSLEGLLGPGTCDLALKVGLNSGPVTAGVLRGKKARFQLFGDTVYTAARMQSHGHANHIHISQETADVLIRLGKGHWVIAREERIVAKGKGELQTYWIRPQLGAQSSGSTIESENKEFDALVSVEGALLGMPGSEMDKLRWAKENHRSIEWTVDLLFKELKWVVAERRDSTVQEPHNVVWLHQDFSAGGVVWDDRLREALFELSDSSWHVDETPMNFRGGKAEDQLRKFVTCLAYNYHQAAFHNYRHACHVLMSAYNMLDRLSAKLGVNRQLNAWAKFAVLLAALIRDMNPAISDNLQVAVENHSGVDDSLAFSTKHSTAMHHSLQRAWDLLLGEKFYALRVCLCLNREEFDCFRQLLINLVLGADLSSGYHSIQRDFRWKNAFREYDSDGEGNDTPKSRGVSDEQAASLLEHVSLAAQWTHTMQHWENYKKWNARLYQELCKDYENGRLSVDPAGYWYRQELLLFDKAIIPLAERLQEPYALGADGSEYLRFALANRREWEATQENFSQRSSCVAYES